MSKFPTTIKEQHDGLTSHRFSSVELTVDAFNQIEKLDKTIRAFLTLCKSEALSQAKKADQYISKNKNISKLCGIPYSVKDVFNVTGMRTTASSKILDSYTSVYNATVITKLNQAGAVLIGKTNNDAFGFGSSTENSDYQVTKNPWNTQKVAGGSSGGSAAAVACNMGTFSIAEDTGGSIRQPCSFNNVTGMKVTYGRVSRYGVLAYGSSLDTIGPIAHTVEDVASILEVIAGNDPHDATSLPHPVPSYSKDVNSISKKKKIGLPKEYFQTGIDREVEKSVKEAITSFEKNGFEIIEVSLPHTKDAIPAYYLSGMSEVSANLARYDGIRFGYSDQSGKTIEDVYKRSREKGFGPEVKRRIMLGTYALSSGYFDAYYQKAQKVRTLLKKEFESVFSTVDFLIAPVSPIPPFAIGEKSSDPLAMWLADAYTVTTNPAGVPSLALPCGFTKNSLPVGMQLIGPQLSESLLLQAGYFYQSKTDWHTRMPKKII